jgi:hypothetical protein
MGPNRLLHVRYGKGNPNNPVVILRFAIVPIEGAVLFELWQGINRQTSGMH